MVNSLDYHLCPSRLAQRIHSFIFLYTPQDFLFPECLLNFHSNFYILTYVENIIKFMEFTFLESALIRGIFTHAPPHSQLAPNFVSSHLRQKEITISPGSILSKICFAQQKRGVEETISCFTKIQSENMKMTCNIWFFIFCMTCNFFKCDGFTVL